MLPEWLMVCVAIATIFSGCAAVITVMCLVINQQCRVELRRMVALLETEMLNKRED
jgi:hypothetical protein